MKYIFLALFAVQMARAQDTWTDRSRIYPDRLRYIPTGLILYHSPSPNYPEETNTPEGPAFKWEHDTCVRALEEGLRLIEAGSFIWMEDRGWYPNMNFSKSQTRRVFGIRGKLEKSATYCFEGNTRYGNQRFAGDALWYVIAEDADGKRYKGVGIIETEENIQKQTP